MISNMILSSLIVLSTSVWATKAPELKTQERRPAPDFTATTAEGNKIKLSEQKGKIVVLEWYNKDCPFVVKYYGSKKMQALQEKYVSKADPIVKNDAVKKDVVWWTIASSAKGKEGFLTPEEAKAARGNMKSTELILDTDGKIGKMYKATNTPQMFVIDEGGKIAYSGAIDDQPTASPKNIDKANNYVDSALQSLQKNEIIKTASTTPYGCGIKY